MTNHLYLYYLNSDNKHVYNIIHPGGTYTPLIQKGYKSKLIQVLGKGFMKIFFHSPLNASLNALFCPSVSLNGKLFTNLLYKKLIISIRYIL